MERILMSYDEYEPAHYKGPKKIPIVLGHGLSWNKFVYRHVARQLSNETGRKVFAVDALNHGESEDIDTTTATLEDSIQDVIYFMKETGIKTANLVCHSTSCVIAHLLAVKKPDLVHKMVMVDHLPYDNIQVHGTLLDKYSSYQNRFLRFFNRDMTLEAARDKIISYAPADKKGVVALHEKIAYDLTKKGDVFAWKHSIESQMQDRMKSDASLFANRPSGIYHGEILVIRCENSDYVSDKGFEDALEYNPNMKLVTMPNTTHLLIFEKTEEFIQEVKNFLEGNNADEEV